MYALYNAVYKMRVIAALLMNPCFVLSARSSKFIHTQLYSQ